MPDLTKSLIPSLPEIEAWIAGLEAELRRARRLRKLAIEAAEEKAPAGATP